MTELAREEMGCSAIAARRVDSRRSQGRHYEYWAIEGCGLIRYYECRVYAVGEGVCESIGQTELPKPALSAG